MPVAKGTSLDPDRTRATIIRQATAALYQRGIDGIGIAELCASVGMSKETLYRHFGSKDGLVEAVLEARSDRVVQWLRDAAEAAGDDPLDRLVAVFEALGRWYAEPNFRGCAVVNAATQHHVGSPVAVVRRHLDRHLALFADISAQAGASQPERLGRQLLMLVEGATVLADHQALGPAAAAEAAEAAVALLRASFVQR
jgi:AcrR family transcriptional regulator